MKHGFIVAFLLIAFVITACVQSVDTSMEGETSTTSSFESLANVSADSSLGRIVVANRNSGDISVIDADTDLVVGTYALPGDSVGEPMYVVWSPITGRVFVGDRANSQVVVFNSTDFSVEATVPAGEGVFHMWADAKGKFQLWVNNDIDATATVIDPVSLEVLATVPLPADLVELGGIPHDVILDPRGRAAYITMLGFEGENDYVIQYSTKDFVETGRAAVGKDPHLSVTVENRYLYVPCQNSDAVYVLDRKSMEEVMVIEGVAGAHGAGMPFDGDVFYTTNLPGEGTDGLIAIDVDTHAIMSTTSTPETVPHNIALAPNVKTAPNGQKLYITHSGATATSVTVYDVTGAAPAYVTTVEVGLNPFGIAYVK